MSIQLKAIPDPQKIEQKFLQIKPKLNLRQIETKWKRKSKTGEFEFIDIKPSELSLSAAKQQTVKWIAPDIDVNQISDKVLEAIDQKSARKLYYIGKGENRVFCGPVIQIIPMSTFASIADGIVSYSVVPPFEDKKFVFEGKKQVLLKIGPKIGKDFLLMIGSNGCVLFESNAFALLSMPVFVVEPTGEYYYLNQGQRVVSLGSGGHLVLYVKDIPILFVTTEFSNNLQPKVDIKSEDKKSPKDIKSKSEPTMSLQNNIKSQVKPEVKAKGEKSVIGFSKIPVRKLKPELPVPENSVKTSESEQIVSESLKSDPEPTLSVSAVQTPDSESQPIPAAGAERGVVQKLKEMECSLIALLVLTAVVTTVAVLYHTGK